MFLAQRIRHVWAHHAGRADTDFLTWASHLEFQLDEKVTIGVEDTGKYLVGIFIYGDHREPMAREERLCSTHA